MKLTLILLNLVAATAPASFAVVPDHSVKDGVVSLIGVGPDNPILYDNDWWYDGFDNTATNLEASRNEFFRVLTQESLFPK